MENFGTSVDQTEGSYKQPVKKEEKPNYLISFLLGLIGFLLVWLKSLVSEVISHDRDRELRMYDISLKALESQKKSEDHEAFYLEALRELNLKSHDRENFDSANSAGFDSH